MSCLWEQFPDEMVHQKTLAKKALTFFGSRLEIATFQAAFTKAKTDGQFVQ